MMTPGASNPIPLPLLVLNGVGAMMMAAGVMGLFAPDAVPALAAPAVAYSLFAVGLSLDAVAVLSILRVVAHRGRGAQSG